MWHRAGAACDSCTPRACLSAQAPELPLMKYIPLLNKPPERSFQAGVKTAPCQLGLVIGRGGLSCQQSFFRYLLPQWPLRYLQVLLLPTPPQLTWLSGNCTIGRGVPRPGWEPSSITDTRVCGASSLASVTSDHRGDKT